MLRLVAGRIVAGILLTLLLTLATYAVFFRVPVDPAIYASPEGTQEERAAIRQELGLEEPLLEQWGQFAWRLGTEADLGTSLLDAPDAEAPAPVRSILADALPPTLSLVLGGFVLTLLLAVPLGMLAALRPRSLLDRSVLAVAVLGVVLHPFIVGLLLHALADRTGIVRGGGYCPIRGEAIDIVGPGQVGACGGAADWVSRMWLPWVTFAVFFLPLYTRMSRARFLDNLDQLYVRTARAKGASERRILFRHVSRNALGPIAAMLAVDVATVVTAAIYIETVFGLPGVGRLVATNLGGSAGYDLHVLVGVVVLVTFTITAANLFSDLTLRALDPRVRTGRGAN
jgi:peptide/nickel transport system permease protein